MASTAPPIAEKSSGEERYENWDSHTDRTVKERVTSYILLQSNTQEDIEQLSNSSHEIEQTKVSPNQSKGLRQRQKKKKNRKRRQRKRNNQNQGKYHLRQTSAEKRSQYRLPPLQYGKRAILDSETELLSWEREKGILKKIYTKIPRAFSYRTSSQSFKVKSYYRNNWRRKMGNQQNKLAVEIFGFVNMQMCKKFLDKAMPSYELKNPNEVMCYASEGHFITEEDSGAPAMRRGRLVAMTVGGVDIDGERIAVGLKMTCFCSWISDNIPSGGTKWHCCKNCCQLNDGTVHKRTHYRQTHHKKPVQVDKK